LPIHGFFFPARDALILILAQLASEVIIEEHLTKSNRKKKCPFEENDESISIVTVT